MFSEKSKTNNVLPTPSREFENSCMFRTLGVANSPRTFTRQRDFKGRSAPSERYPDGKSSPCVASRMCPTVGKFNWQSSVPGDHRSSRPPKWNGRSAANAESFLKQIVAAAKLPFPPSPLAPVRKKFTRGRSRPNSLADTNPVRRSYARLETAPAVFRRVLHEFEERTGKRHPPHRRDLIVTAIYTSLRVRSANPASLIPPLGIACLRTVKLVDTNGPYSTIICV